MKDNKGKDDLSRLLISDSLLPDIFLVRYAQELSKNALLVYLWINMKGKKDGFEESEIKKYKIIPEDQIAPVLAELMAANLISRKDKSYFFEDIKAREVGEYIEASKARGDGSEPADLLSNEKERKILSDSISSTFYQGELPYIFYRLIDKCLYEYKFDGRVCYKLFEEGYEQSIHRSLTLMEKMARSWYEKGYTDIKSLEKQLEINKRTGKLIKLTGSLMRKRLNGLDIERVTSWAEDLGATEELVNLAFRVNDFRSNLTLKNVGDTLAKWHDQGIKTAEEASRFEEEEHKENKRKAVRKSARTGSAWRTGEEAGIAGADADVSTKEVSKTAAAAEDNAPDDILDMFGDADEDD
ncbi:MAG: DnaD domain protein [Clostridiales bacterium]|nr:DnaD domain protein [Clostridiales bacterium]